MDTSSPLVISPLPAANVVVTVETAEGWGVQSGVDVESAVHVVHAMVVAVLIAAVF